MDHTTTTDLAALEAEIDALLLADAEISARVDALLTATTPITPAVDTTAALRRLQRTARHAARLGALIERQQAALTAQLDEMEAS
jgi:hypothetical protein